ncbi:hypothetical protein MYRNA_226 [Mycobacterium phage Myrna]|uniref:Uncharacterized protein n=1 Tax=Mycobacterium phage Myrna TaxID=546805 RepID=B5LJJ6_9CAUD|nr:gp226 [Mycobacterium phage Myrna]ACH62193.1 hypothetical protein MYRNA_226 [Mycobacterium phage Myrna]
MCQMEYIKQDPKGPIGEEICSSVYGATYCEASGDTIRTLVVAEVDHAVVTWAERPRVWQYWYQEHEVWHHGGDFPSAAKAKAKGEERKAEHVVVAEARTFDPDSTVAVEANWQNPYSGSKPIKVLCSSPKTAEDIAVIFKRLGCSTATREARPDEIENGVAEALQTT